MTVEANPETVTVEVAAALRRGGVTRVARSAVPPSAPARCARTAGGTDDVRRAFYALRDAGFDNISVDLLYGVPGQNPTDLERDLDEALALSPEHVSYYELEAKPGTRFTHTHEDELLRQSEAMEVYFEHVVEALTGAGYRWYETANFCRADAGATSAPGTTSRTGSAGTTSGSGSRRGLHRRRPPLAETPRASGAT